MSDLENTDTVIEETRISRKKMIAIGVFIIVFLIVIVVLGVVLAIISPTIPEQTTDTDKLISSQQPINTSVAIDYNCASYNSKYEQYVYGSTACHAILAKKTLSITISRTVCVSQWNIPLAYKYQSFHTT
uniref:uncharacterized protein LOC120337561 isoform X2 n=1 Tax=Styela clava TaxID=7725 RepID=UPI001939B54D|nr:uncharacterized protein LOC120337561 isoform X2 [Styela clava]